MRFAFRFCVSFNGTLAAVVFKCFQVNNCSVRLRALAESASSLARVVHCRGLQERTLAKPLNVTEARPGLDALPQLRVEAFEHLYHTRLELSQRELQACSADFNLKLKV